MAYFNLKADYGTHLREIEMIKFAMNGAVPDYC